MNRNFYFIGIAFFGMINGIFNQLWLIFALLYVQILAGPLLFREYTEADGSSHRVLTGDYATWVGEWAPSALPPGQKLQQPAPLFKKLDDSVVAEELARLGAAA